MAFRRDPIPSSLTLPAKMRQCMFDDDGRYRLELIWGIIRYCLITSEDDALRMWLQLELQNHGSLGEGKILVPKVILMEMSVFSTIFVNSSKLILPSRSVSASMIVLSTILPHVVSQRPSTYS